MHPILAQRGRWILYFAAWTILGGAAAVALAARGVVSWPWALAAALPATVAYGFVCLSAHYICQALPLGPTAAVRLAVTHLGAAGLSTLFWGTAVGICVKALADWSGEPALVAAHVRYASILLTFGVLAFLLSSAVHYSLAAVEARKDAERRALELELLSREAELKSLKAQIHPHFLFNSLNSIGALIGRDSEGARALCVHLADFLRGSLTLGSKKTVPLGEELAMAERLLTIEKARFGERLGTTLAVDEDVRKIPVPPLILLPLVENAVTHGIAHLLDGGTVSLKAGVRDGRLEVFVENPRDPDTPRRKGTGLGLDNVRKRLQGFYGRKATLRAHEQQETFRVTLSLPLPD